MKKIILSIGLLFFIDTQTSEKKAHIYQGTINYTNRLIAEIDELSEVCSYMDNFSPKKIKKGLVVQSIVTGYAKHIQQMRKDAERINNPSWCIGNFSLSNYIRGLSTHHSAMHKAQQNIIDIHTRLMIKKKPYNPVVEDMYIWSRETRSQCLQLKLLLTATKKNFDKINRLYHEKQSLKSSKVQEIIKESQLNFLKIYSDEYKNVREFFGYQSYSVADVSRVADID